jgi:hypothetical protein
MSGAQTSTFADPNILYRALSGAGTAEVQRNQLLNQQTQQGISAADIAMTGQAAASLLNMSEPDAAAAYGPMIQSLQAQGFAKNAPAQYPGHAASQALVQRAMPLIDQFKMGYITPPGTQAAIDAALRPGVTPATTGATGTGVAAPAPATSGTIEPDALARAQAVRDGLIKRGLDVDTATAFAANALHESSANPNTGPGDQGASHGLFQWRDDRYNRFGSVFGRPLDNAPLDQQLDYVVHELGTTEGAARDRIAAAQGPAAKAAAVSQFYLRPKDVQAEISRRSGTASQLVSQWGGAGTTTAAPVIAGDSLAQPDGLGGTGVRGASPSKVLDAVRADSRAGKYSGQPVVLSTGASNNPNDFDSIEQQIREAQGGNAGQITVLGVGPAVEAKAPGTNAKLQALAKSYGANFVPLPADQMSPDGVHPTAQGYATLKAAIAPAPAAPGGVAARTGGVDVAGPGAGPGGAPGQPAAMPRDQAVAQAQRTGQAVPVAGVGGLWALPNGNLSGTPPTAPAATPQPQAQVPQPPANRVMPGAADGPPAPQPPAPATRANLPRAADVPTGVNSQQYRDAADLQRRALILEAQVDPTGRLKQLAAGLRQQAQLLLQTDSVVQTQEGQLHPLTGQIGDPTKPLADYHETSPGSGIWVGGPGTEPRFQPPGRLVVTPGGDVYQTTTGGAVLLKHTDPQAVAALEEAKAQGATTGKQVAEQLPNLMVQARNAAAQEGQIDYASNQLREAAKGGVPTGYFSQGLATAAAAAKSLGIDTSSLGINPEAVGNIQTAQKTLSVIGGAILRQALGPGSAITDGKIEQFIHTQPGIETDPQALQRIMSWARSQYTYERELGHAAVTEAAKPENAGRLPPHWLPAYYRDHGFAPIYDPGTQEMRQPDGRQPARETPPAAPSQPATAPALPPAAASRLKEGTVTTFGNGQKWTLRNGQPAQVQ